MIGFLLAVAFIAVATGVAAVVENIMQRNISRR